MLAKLMKTDGCTVQRYLHAMFANVGKALSIFVGKHLPRWQRLIKMMNIKANSEVPGQPEVASKE